MTYHNHMWQNLMKEINNNKWKGKPGHRTGEEACGPNTNCVNLEWGYDCECAPGYEVNPQGIVPIRIYVLSETLLYGVM